MYFCIWKSPLIILLFLGYKAISVAGAECNSPCQNGQNCTSLLNCTCAEGRFGVNCETVPSTVSNISLAIGIKEMQQVLFVNWTTPQSDVSISQYHVQYTNETYSWTSTSTSAVFAILTGLNADTKYRVRVRAVSAAGSGNWSKVQTVRTYNFPSKIRNISLTKRVNTGPALEVNWAIPQTDLAIFQYNVQYRRRETTVWDNVTIRGSPPLASTILNELHAGSEYRVRVQAVSAAGDGMWSAVQTKRTYKLPPHPNHHTVSAVPVDRRGVIKVSWAASTVPSGELPITGYSIRYNFGMITNNIKTLTVQSSPAEVTGLLPGTEYQVLVASVNALGTGEYCCNTSTTVHVRTHEATPQPTVSLANAILQSLSISWSVTSPQDVTNYMVFWWKESAEISKSVALDDTKFVIEGLLSNTAYHVVVLASGPLGNVNSTSKVFYTAPNKVQGSVSVLVLPAQVLQVSWKTSEDAGQSAIEYIVNITVADMDFANSTSVMDPITSVRISGLPQYSSGTVSVWVKNPGTLSKPVVLRFRMLNIVTNVIGVSAEWVDAGFTSLRVPVPEGGVYRISYWAVNKSTGPELKVATTSSSSQVINDFIPDYIYTIVVEDWTGSAEEDEQSNGVSTVEDNNAATVGSFLGGLVAGGVCVVLVEGIVLGLVRLRKQRKGVESTQEEEKKTEATYDTVGPKETAALSEHVAMETNPAYASVH